jgi:hypothetical protein
MKNATRIEPHRNAKFRSPLVVLFALALATAILSSLGITSASPQASSSTEVKIVPITAATIARLPKGQNFVIDLTRSGAAYDIDYTRSPVDLSRIVVKTAAGQKPLNDHLKATFGRRGGEKSARLALGATEGIKKIFDLGAPTKPPTEYAPIGGTWQCYNEQDCINMVLAGVCQNNTATCQDVNGTMFCGCNKK